MRFIPRPAALEAFGDALWHRDCRGFHLEGEAGLLFGGQFRRGGENFHSQGVRFLPDFHFFEAVDARAAAAALVLLLISLVHSLGAAIVQSTGRTVFRVKITVIVITGHAEPAFRRSVGMCMGVGLPVKALIGSIEADWFP